MGSKDGICINGGLTNSYDRHINAFAQDEVGEAFTILFLCTYNATGT